MSSATWVQNNDNNGEYFGPVQYVDISQVNVPEGYVPIGVQLYQKNNRVGLQLKVFNPSTKDSKTVSNAEMNDYVPASTYCDSRPQTCPQCPTDTSKNKVIQSVATVKTGNRFGLSIAWQDRDATQYTGSNVATNFANDNQYFQNQDGVEGLYCDTNPISNNGALLLGVQFWQKGNRIAIKGLFQFF